MAISTGLSFLMGAIVFALIAVLVYALFVRRDLERLEKLDEHSRSFFKAATTLLEDADLPEACRALLVFLARELADPASTRRLKHALSRRSSMSSQEIGQRKKFRNAILDQDYFLASPNSKRIFVGAIKGGLLAISYRDPWRGPYVRSRMAEILADSSRAGTFAVCVQQSFVSNSAPLQAA